MENYNYCKKYNIKVPMSYKMARYYFDLGFTILCISNSCLGPCFIKLKKGTDLISPGSITFFKRSDIRWLLSIKYPPFWLCEDPYAIEHL